MVRNTPVCTPKYNTVKWHDFYSLTLSQKYQFFLQFHSFFFPLNICLLNNYSKYALQIKKGLGRGETSMFWALLKAKISSQNTLDTDTILYYKFMFVSFPFLSD
jgi:hypothetical protein